MNRRSRLRLVSAASVAVIPLTAAGKAAAPTEEDPSSAALAKEEARAIAKEACHYGFPMVDSALSAAVSRGAAFAPH